MLCCVVVFVSELSICDMSGLMCIGCCVNFVFVCFSLCCFVCSVYICVYMLLFLSSLLWVLCLMSWLCFIIRM